MVLNVHINLVMDREKRGRVYGGRGEGKTSHSQIFLFYSSFLMVSMRSSWNCLLLSFTLSHCLSVTSKITTRKRLNDVHT